MYLFINLSTVVFFLFLSILFAAVCIYPFFMVEINKNHIYLYTTNPTQRYSSVVYVFLSSVHMRVDVFCSTYTSLTNYSPMVSLKGLR